MRGWIGGILAGWLLFAAGPGQAADEADVAKFTGSEACVDCHSEEAAAWAGSHHGLAWTEPGPDTVLGDFADAEFEHRGVVSRFRRDGDRYLVETQDIAGERGVFEVVGVAGIDPLQQYLLEPVEGRHQVLDVAWDTEAGSWFHVFPEQEIGLNDGLHWSGPYKSWEARCAECHATDYSRNYDTAAGVYAPVMTETGVGCEACHGPASLHLDWADADRDGGSGAVEFPEGYAASGFAFDPAAGAEAEIQQCAGCHARRETFFDGNPLPGTPFNDSYNLALLRDGLYHPDGTIRDEVYVYGSFLQSKMYDRGVRCSDCHDPHSAELKAEGNAICTQCHSPAGNSEFPTLRPALYDGPGHHFHEEGSEGAQCVSCHMAERVYMGNDWRRDHSYRIPRPDLAEAAASPDACTDCHTDRDAAWAAEAVSGWYPDSENRGEHFGPLFAAARADPAGQTVGLLALAGDPEQPGIVRASALDLLAPVADVGVANRASGLMADPDPLVRAAAATLQRGAPAGERLNRLLPSLNDPVRMVRVAAVRTLIGTDPAGIPQNARPAMERAMGEWQAALAVRMDFPETHMSLGGIGLTLRNPGLASQGFRQAVMLDPQLVDGWTMLARLAVAQNDIAGARDLLEEALVANPGNAGLEAMRAELEATR